MTRSTLHFLKAAKRLAAGITLVLGLVAHAAEAPETTLHPPKTPVPAPPPPPPPPLAAPRGASTNADGLKPLNPEREARLKELRERRAAREKDMTPAEREQRRKVILQRLHQRIEVLKQKQAAGPLSPEETKSLRRLEDLEKTFQAGILQGGTAPGDKKKKE